MFRTVKELVEIAEKKVSDFRSYDPPRNERQRNDKRRCHCCDGKNLDVMEKAIEDGLKGVQSVTGLTGGDAVLIQNYLKENTPLSGHLLLDAVSKAVATNEVNAAMGTICATPTAVVQVLFPDIICS